MLEIRRREFITLLGGLAAAWPLAARAQQRALPVMGVLVTGEGSGVPFREALREQGYVEGRNLAIEPRFADSRFDRLPELAADLVSRRVAVIYAGGSPAALAAKAATPTIPIVFAIGGDPVELGLVSSLNRPGGNITGAYSLLQAITAKRVQLLHEIVPTARSIGFLVNPAHPVAQVEISEADTAARILGVQLAILNASTPAEIETTFANLAEQRIAALVVSASALFGNRRDQIVSLAAHHSVPTIWASREPVEAGGLMSYGTSGAETRRVVATYIARILKGDKPADLAVQQSTRTEMVLNLKTARLLDIRVPPTLLSLADEVIE
jgi:putative ABC transport system substrate-binding protein